MRWPFSRRERAARAAFKRWAGLRPIAQDGNAYVAFRAGFHLGVISFFDPEKQDADHD